MNNLKIILSEAVNSNIITKQQLNEFLAKGSIPPFYTFQEWKKRGYIVKKGEKAKFSCYIWMPKKGNKSTKEKNQDDIPENGFFRKLTHIFTIDQVKKINF